MSVVIAKGRNNSPGGRQLDEHHHQDEQHRDDRPVDEQQHQEDHADGDHRDQLDAAVAGVVLVVGERRGAGDVGLDPRWRRSAWRRCHGPLHGLVRQAFALVACQVEPERRRPCRRRSALPRRSADRPRSPGCARRASCRPRACRSGRRSTCAQRRRAVGRLPGRSSPSCWSRTPGKFLPMRCIACSDGASLGANDTACASPTFSSCGAMTLTMTRQRQPAQQDRHREQANEAGDHRVRADVCVAHADFTRQKVWAFTPSVVLSSLTTPSTVIRQVMLSPSLCATMFGLAAGAVVVRVSDHGSDDVLRLLGLCVEVEVVDGRHRSRCRRSRTSRLWG